MAYDNQSRIRVLGAPAFQVAPVGLFIPIGVPQTAQVDSSEVHGLLARLVELYEQKKAVEADKERLATEKANVEEALNELKEDNDELKEEVKELRKRDKVLHHRKTPRTLFLDVLVPMASFHPSPNSTTPNLIHTLLQLRTGPKPKSVPGVLEVEIRKPCRPVDNYAEIETRTFNTDTGEVIQEKKRLICKSQKSAALRLTYLS